MSGHAPAPARAERAIPGPTGWTKWRSIGQFSSRPHEHYLELATTWGGIIRLNFPGETVVLLAEPAYIEHVLHHNHRNYVKQTGRWRALRDMWGNGLVMSDGDFWKRQRQRIQPAFHQEIIAGHLNIFTDEARYASGLFEAAAANGQPRDIFKDMLAHTLRGLMRSMFGSDIEGKTDVVYGALMDMHPYINPVSLMSLLNPPLFLRRLLMPGHRRFERAMKEIDRIFDEILARRRDGTASKSDLLDHLLSGTDEDTASTMSRAELRDELMVLLMAGHETSAITLSWAWYLLARTPAVRQRLQNEVDTVLGDRLVTADDFARLPYTKMFIDEVLRMYPAIYAFDRRAVADDVVDGYRIPAGATVAMSSYAMHHNPRFWDRPEVFDPERFAPEHDAGRPDYCYFPFGGGPRRCIGFRFAQLQLTASLTTMVRRFTMELVPDQPVRANARLNLMPSHMTMTVQRRETC